MEKIKLKYYTQYQDHTCGPVCLMMILRYYKIRVSLDKLVRICKTTKSHGTNHVNLVRAVKKFGFRCIHKSQSSLKEIKQFIRNNVPVIVNYYHDLDEMGHYAIVCGYDDKEKALILADPSRGYNYNLSYKKFLEFWHNHNKNSIKWILAVEQKNR